VGVAVLVVQLEIGRFLARFDEGHATNSIQGTHGLQADVSFEVMIQDLRLAVRLLLKDRSFTITALLTLAVCIGANTAMFSIVRSVLLRPLPLADSSRLVLLYNSYPNAGAPRVGTAIPDYYDRLTAVTALDQQALFRTEGMTFGDEVGVERLTSLRATPSFFGSSARGGGPAVYRGRRRARQEQQGRAQLRFWQRKFGGAQVVSRSVQLNSTPYGDRRRVSRLHVPAGGIDLYLPPLRLTTSQTIGVPAATGRCSDT
jgi:hypothetical protein